MSPLWLLPGLVALVGAAALLALVRSAAEEARLLAAEVRRQRDVVDAVARLGEAVRATEWRRRDHR